EGTRSWPTRGTGCRGSPSPARRERPSGCGSSCGRSPTSGSWGSPTPASRPCSLVSPRPRRRSPTIRSRPSRRTSASRRPATAGTALQTDAVAVSALPGEGVEEFRARVDALASEAAASEPERTTHVVLRPGRPRFAVKRDERGTWHVEGRSVERWVLETDLDDDDELAKLQRNLRREGVFRVLEASGIGEGDDVEIRGRV